MAGRTDSDPRFPDLRRHRVAGARDSEAQMSSPGPTLATVPGAKARTRLKLPPSVRKTAGSRARVGQVRHVVENAGGGDGEARAGSLDHEGLLR